MFIWTALGTISVTVIVYYIWAFQYWKRRNLPFLQPQIPFGNVPNPFTCKEHMGITMQKVYKEMKKRKWKHGGVYQLTTPIYVVVDLDFVKNIMAKDFEYFGDRGTYYNEKDDPVSAHLFAMAGSKWKNLRTKLTPSFTPGKIKAMFQILLECEAKLQEKMLLEYNKKQPINIKDVLNCFTIEIIVSCVFGLACKTDKDETSPFKMYGEHLFSSASFVKIVFASTCPDLARRLGVRLTPKAASDFFLQVAQKCVAYRENNNRGHNDFLQLLVDMKNNNVLTLEQIAAQIFVFFLAGFETSANLTTFVLYELSKNQDIQEKARAEIETVLIKSGGKITYESLQDLKFVSQIIDESMRKYPPLLQIPRKCVQNYKVPGEDVIIEKGTCVVIPVLAIHYDEEYYPNPEKFDPERFTEENKKLRHQYSHIPFGEGPRICIAKRFGMLNVKLGLVSLLKHYKFTVDARTMEPLRMIVNSFVTAAEGDIWLNVEKI